MTPGQTSPYGTQTAPAGPTHGRRGNSISLQTLIIASVASAVTSFTVSKIWGPGTLFSAAATPILVALISELVRRPVVGVSSTAQKVAGAPLRYRPRGRSGAPTPAPPPPAIDPTIDQSRRPPAPANWEPAAAPPPIELPRTRPRWRLVLTTGLLACMLVIGLVTALDVLAGQSITGNGDASTYFSGPAKTAPPAPTTPPPPTLGATGVTSGTTGPTAPATTTTPAGTTAAPIGASGATTGASGPSGATGPTTPPTAATQSPTGP